MPTLVDRLVLYRLILVIVVFGAPAALVGGAEDWRLTPTFLGLLFPIVVTAFLTTVYLLVLLRFTDLRLNKIFVAMQYILDAVVLTVPIALTDGTSSAFVTLYVFLIVVTSITHSTRFALTMALLSSSLVAAISYMEVNGWLPGIAPPDRIEIVRAILVRDFIYFGFFFLVGILPGRLVETLRRTDQALEYLRQDYATMREVYRMIVEHAPSGIGLVNAEGRIMLLNRAGRRIADVVAGPGNERRVLGAMLKDGPDDNGEIRINDGTTEHLLGYSVVDVGTTTVEGNRLLIFQDVTDKRKLEESLEEQRRLGAIGQMSANLAHEVRNPLAAISNSLQLLSGKLSLGENEQRLFDIQEKEIKRLEKLVSDFLEYARPIASQYHHLTVQSLVDRLSERLENHPEMQPIKLEFDVRDGDAGIDADPELFNQIVGNLVLNAAQWAPDGSRVVVGAGLEGRDLIVRVSDEGPGIAPEIQERLFEPFFGNRKGGTGLGLAIAWAAANAIDGRVELVRSQPGETVFQFRCPTVAEPVAEVANG